MEAGNKQDIRLIQAAPGRGKTHFICQLIKNNIDNKRFVVALKSKDCANTFESDIRDVLDDHQQGSVVKIYSSNIDEYGQNETKHSVSKKLNLALEEESYRVVIICQKSLDTYRSWYSFQGKFVLIIDELFDELYFAEKKLTESSARILNINSENYRSVDIKHIRQAATVAFKQNNGESILHPETINLLEHLIDAEYISIKKHSESFKIVTLRESRIFNNLKYFSDVYLAAMILEGTRQHLVCKHKGISFISSEWKRQGERFKQDNTVTIIPLMRRNATQNYLNKPPSEKVRNFERLLDKAIEILRSKPANCNIHLMTNKDSRNRVRTKLLDKKGLKDSVVEIGVTTHGKHDWMEARKFALLYVSQWHPDFADVSERYTEKLGININDFIDAYEVTHQYEIIAQAACRGQVRKREGIIKPSWIVVLDIKTAEYLKKNILYNAVIDTSQLLEITNTGSQSTAPANAGIQSVAKRKYELSPTQAKKVYRRCEKYKATDVSNLEHLSIMDAVVFELFPDKANIATAHVIS